VGCKAWTLVLAVETWLTIVYFLYKDPLKHKNAVSQIKDTEHVSFYWC